MEDDAAGVVVLVAIRGVHAGQVFRLEPKADKVQWSIGRTDENDISLAGDDEVSSSHAQINFDRERRLVKVMDLGSTNGTYVTNEKGIFIVANDCESYGCKSLKLKKRESYVRLHRSPRTERAPCAPAHAHDANTFPKPDHTLVCSLRMPSDPQGR